jgi:Protein of unknown function (DUF4244)
MAKALRFEVVRSCLRTIAGLVGRLRSAGSEAGMSTAEYAIGTVAACAFAGILLKILTSPEVADLLKGLIKRAFSVAF